MSRGIIVNHLFKIKYSITLLSMSSLIWWWASKNHQANANDYNQAWRDYIERKLNASFKEVKKFAAGLMKKYGFEDFKW